MQPDLELVPPPSDNDFTGTEDVWEVVETSTATETFEKTLRRRGGERDVIEVLQGDLIDTDRYFGKQGLLHASLRADVIELGPIGTGPGQTVWHYSQGVWLPGGGDEIRRRCRKLLGQRWRRSHVEGIVSDIAANKPLITDAQPTEWINTATGLLDWRTSELLPHSADVPSTYQLACQWNPNATCPTVDAWLAEVAPADAIDLIWEVIGTAIYGDQPFHRAVILYGPGRNGKSTLLRLISALIGQAHIASVTLQSLGESRFASAELFGKVANIAGDLDARSIGRTDVFKQAVGADLITAERKHGQPFTFTNRATMIFAANELPGSADLTEGFFSKWVVIPFTGLQLAPGDEDTTLEPRMHTELEGVLVKAVEGLQRAMQRGKYDRPASVTEATTGYQVNADPLRRFIEDELEMTGAQKDDLPRSAVYRRYKTWCDDNGAKPLGANRFWPRLVAASNDTINPDAKIIQGERFCSGLNFSTGGSL
jgi:putative DNA primase/helicase